MAVSLSSPRAAASPPRLFATEAALPATRPSTLILEGEPQPVTLRLFSELGVPLITYYPQGLMAESACSGEGCGVFFFPPDSYEAEVQFFFPVDATTADVEQAITQPGGYLAANGWVSSGEYTDAEALAYPWATKVILFQGASRPITGAVYIGAINGVAFRATVMFSLEAGDSFAPLADAILTHVQVRAQAANPGGEASPPQEPPGSNPPQ